MTIEAQLSATKLTSAVASSLFGPGVMVAAADPGRAAAPAFAAEAAAIADAVPSRRYEFAAGRRAAHRAMAGLGLDPAPVLAGPDRAPVWPSGLIGSITHTDEVCLAAVARDHVADGLGLDVERFVPMDRTLIDLICDTDADRALLEATPPLARGRLATLMFSAKEAAYKAQYAVSGALFGFEGISITPDPARGRFRAVFQVEAGPFYIGDSIEGRYAAAGGFLVTTVTLRLRGGGAAG